MYSMYSKYRTHCINGNIQWNNLASNSIGTLSCGGINKLYQFIESMTLTIIDYHCSAFGQSL